MRYYCPECKSEIKIKDGNCIYNECKLCLSAERGILQPIPEWETPDQYQKRTGRPWKGAVWVNRNGKKTPCEWGVVYWIDHYYEEDDYTYDLSTSMFVLCAQSDTCPPEDWEGEEC